MDEDGTTSAPGEAGDGREPGERRRRLERAPGERYADAPEASPDSGGRSAASSAGQAFVVAVVSAALIALLGGPLSLTVGLLAVAAVGGWLIGSLLRPAVATAVALAVGAVIVGLVGVWLFSRLEGGVLDPIAYLGAVHGPLVIVELALAGVAAAAATR